MEYYNKLINNFIETNNIIINEIDKLIGGVTYYYNNGIWMNEKQYNFNIKISIDKNRQEYFYQKIKDIILLNLNKNINNIKYYIKHIQVFGQDIDTHHFTI